MSLPTYITRTRSAKPRPKQVDDTYINSEIVEVPNTHGARGILANRIKDNQRVVLARIVRVIIRVGEVVAGVSICGHVFLVG